MFTDPTQPNLADFEVFLTEQVGISSSALPSTSPYPEYALTGALGLVLNYPSAGVLYTIAVYNCATHLLFVITPDQQGQQFFTTARSRKGYALDEPSTGLVATTFTQGTGVTLAQPKWAEGLTVDELGFYKTSWGRTYLAWNQAYGPSIVGLS